MTQKILINNELSEEVFSQCRQAKSEIIIYSAFIKQQTIEKIGENIGKGIDVKVLARWQCGDLIAGVSDLEVYNYCSDRGWKFGIKQSLHAKVFIFDRDTAIIGSGNATEAGFGSAIRSNDEVSVNFKPDIKDVSKIIALESGATWLDSDLFEELAQFVAIEKEKGTNLETIKWPHHIIERFYVPVVEALWISDLPQVSYEQAVISSGSSQKLKAQFEQSDLFVWLLQILSSAEDGYTNFGWLSHKLHNVLLDSPKPYRKEVKDYVALIYDWIEKTETTKISLKRYSRTTSMHLNETN